MLVVKRPFRNYGVILQPGHEVRAEDVKRYKGRIHYGFLVDVTDDTFERWNDYFKVKFGTPIKLLNEKPAEPVKAKPVVAKVKQK